MFTFAIMDLKFWSFHLLSAQETLYKLISFFTAELREMEGWRDGGKGHTMGGGGLWADPEMEVNPEYLCNVHSLAFYDCMHLYVFEEINFILMYFITDFKENDKKHLLQRNSSV